VVAFIDLDEFKAANDRYGHPEGDGLLKHVADQLWRVAGEDGLVGLLGGDEFLVRGGAGLRLQRDEPDWSEALAMLESAARLSDDEGGDAELAYERLETTLQIGQLLGQWPPDEGRPEDAIPRALAAAEEAAAGLLDLNFRRSVQAHLVAARIEPQSPDRPDSAIARLERARDLCVERGDQGMAQACERRLTQWARRRSNQ
jgi:GGDEF domain-containing protein